MMTTLRTSPPRPSILPTSRRRPLARRGARARPRAAQPRRDRSGPRVLDLRERRHDQRPARNFFNDPRGMRLFTEQRALDSHTIDLDALYALPSGTLGHAYASFMKRHGLTPDVFDGAPGRHPRPAPGVRDPADAPDPRSVARRDERRDRPGRRSRAPGVHVGAGRRAERRHPRRARHAEDAAPRSPDPEATSLELIRLGRAADRLVVFPWEDHWATPLDRGPPLAEAAGRARARSVVTPRARSKPPRSLVVGYGAAHDSRRDHRCQWPARLATSPPSCSRVGHSVIATRRAGTKVAHLADLAIEWRDADLADGAALAKAFAGAEAVFHCAAMVTVKREVTPEMVDANVTGTERVIAACATAGVKRLVHTSSVVAIGLTTNGAPSDETARWNFDELGLSDAYAITKHQAEDVVRARLDRRGDRQPDLHVRPARRAPELRQDDRRRRPPPRSELDARLQQLRRRPRRRARHDPAWQRGKRGERYILGGHDMTYKQCFDTIARVAGVKPPRFKAPLPVAKLLGTWGDFQERRGKDPIVNSTQIRYAYTDKFRFTSARAQSRARLHVRPARARDHRRDRLVPRSRDAVGPRQCCLSSARATESRPGRSIARGPDQIFRRPRLRGQALTSPDVRLAAVRSRSIFRESGWHVPADRSRS